MTRQLNHPQATVSLSGQTTHMRTIIYNDEAAPWRRSNHLMGTRWFPSSDDSNNKFCRNPCITRTEIITNETSGLAKIPAVSATKNLMLSLFSLKPQSSF
jgi:hypothetical protein